MRQWMPHRSAVAKFALAPYTLLRAAFSAIDDAFTSGLPGYEALVAAPTRIRPPTQLHYRNDATLPTNHNGAAARQSHERTR